MSRADRETLDRVLAEFGGLPWPELVARVAALPECQELKRGSRRRIGLAEIARAVGHDPARVRMILEAQREKDEVAEFIATLKTKTPERVPVHA